MVSINKNEKKEAIIYGLEVLNQRVKDLEDSEDSRFVDDLESLQREAEIEEEIKTCENLISFLTNL
tara:strand:+ start:1272 stop:1469 length:198 start_codon:yes stop_codon:yes gene_type:complete